MNFLDFIKTHRIRRDPWPPDYQSAVQLPPETETSRVEVGYFYEARPKGDWKARTSSASFSSSPPLLFIDGIRNMHLPLHLFDRTGLACYGGIGSIATGAIRILPRQIQTLSESLEAYIIRRFCIACGMDTPFDESSKIPGIPGIIEGSHSKENTPDAPLVRLQRLMRNEENALVNRLAMEERAGIILVDGPLSRGILKTQTKTPVVGYVKTLHTRYLEPPYDALMLELKPGQRTPLFSLGNDRVSCYLRLTAPASIDTPLAGLVRIEMPISDQDLEISNLLTGVLPALGASRLSDPRAPQNLYPVQVLEKTLRRLIGQDILIRRQLEKYLFANMEKIS